MLGLIVAVAKNGVIGNRGCIPWKIKGEQRWFRELTTGNTIIMGRRSFEEIGHPLPNRRTILLSKTLQYEDETCTTVGSLEEALNLVDCKKEDVFLAGGYGVYKEGIALVDRMYITEIELQVEGDTYFPTFDKTMFQRISEERIEGEVPYTRVVYARIE